MYNNLNLFQVFYEGDIMFFNPAFCQALSSVLNDKLSIQLLEFVDKVKDTIKDDNNAVAEGLRKSILLLEEHTLPRARILTLHIKLNKQLFHGASMFDYIRTLSLESVRPETLIGAELVDIHQCLEQVINLIPDMVDRIEARQKKDYEKFLDATLVASQGARAFSMKLDSSGNSGLIKFNEKGCAFTIENNKELFYAYHEVARFTGLGQIIKRQQDLTTIYAGLTYIQYCDSHCINAVDRILI